MVKSEREQKHKEGYQQEKSKNGTFTANKQNEGKTASKMSAREQGGGR